MMTYNEFLEKLLVEDIRIRVLLSGKYGKNNYEIYTPNSVSDDTPIIYWQWCTGGVTGGSCWDEGGHNNYAYVSDDKEENELDRVLEVFYPSITFLEYKNIDFIHSDSCTEYEYYGNSTTYAVRYVKVKDLYDFLIKKNAL